MHLISRQSDCRRTSNGSSLVAKMTTKRIILLNESNWLASNDRDCLLVPEATRSATLIESTCQESDKVTVNLRPDKQLVRLPPRMHQLCLQLADWDRDNSGFTLEIYKLHDMAHSQPPKLPCPDFLAGHLLTIAAWNSIRLPLIAIFIIDE